MTSFYLSKPKIMISFLFRETFDESSEPLQYKTRKSDHSNMLSSSEASLSPKAKVSYDDGEFAVEIPLRDYKVIFRKSSGFLRRPQK